MLAQLLSILGFVCLAMASFGLGRPILRGLGIRDEAGGFAHAVWSLALGLVVAGMLLLGLGMLGLLYVPVIGVLTLAGCFWGVGEIVRARRDSILRKTQTAERGGPQLPDDDAQRSCAPPGRWLCCGIFLAAAAACLGSLIGALAPPTAGDAMCYHLELPKTFLADHTISFLPYHDNSTFPLLTEMWYLWALAFDGGVCAQLVHWGMGILLGLATAVLAQPILGRRWSMIAGALVVLVPGVNNQMTAPLNDIALATMTTLALAAWWRAVVDQNNVRWFIIAGLFGGGALGTKYLGLVFALAVAATWVWMLVKHPRRRRTLLAGAGITVVVAASVAGPWYARAAWHRGNPVYPFLGEVFAHDGPSAAAPRETLPKSKSPLGRNPLQLAAAPWQVTMHPEQFGGRAHQLGILFLVAIPGVAFCRRLRGLGILMAVAAVYGLVWFLLRQNVRFLFPIIPLLCVVTTWVWVELRRFPRTARLITVTTFALIVFTMAAVPLARSRDQLAVAGGFQTRSHYLVLHEPTYRAAAVTNLVATRDSHVLTQDYRTFYFDCPITRETTYRRLTGYDRQITTPGQFSRKLRAAGFTHVLLAETIEGDGIQYDPTLSRLADAQLAGDSADGLFVLTNYCYRDVDGTVRHYRLVALRDEQPPSTRR